jgi:hypothetical protein
MSGRPTFDKVTVVTLFALVLLVLLGAALATIGYALDEARWGLLKFLALATGGGFFAAGLTQLIASIGRSLFGDRVLESLETLTKAKLISEESDLADIRRKHYHYYKSRNENGAFWRCVELDFSDKRNPGVASTQVCLKDPSRENEFIYTYEAAVREHTLILLSYRQLELPAKVIFPTFKKDLLGSSVCGLTFHENWIPENAVDPAMILRERKFPTDEDGFLSAEVAVEIENEWYKKFFEKQARGIPLSVQPPDSDS